MMGAVSLAASLLGLGTRSAVACCGCCGWPFLSLSGVPCHSGGLWLAGSGLIFPNLQPPLFCPRRMWMDGIGLAGRNRLGPLVLLFLWSSGPLLLWPPTSYWTAALFSGNSSLMFLDDRPLMPSLRLFNVMQLLDNQGVGGSIQCRHHVKSKSHARQPGCLAVNCP